MIQKMRSSIIKFCSISILLTAPLIAEVKVSVPSVLGLNDKLIDFSDKSVTKKTDIEKVRIKIEEMLSKVVGVGSSEFQLILSSDKGKVENVQIFKRTGDKDFKKEFKLFLKDLKEIRFKPIKAPNNLLKVRFTVEIKNKREVQKEYSIYKDENYEPYKEYLIYLQTKKKYSKEKIKNLLHSEKRSVTKSMLMAIHYDYTLNDVSKATEFYNLVIEHKLDRFKKSEEAIFLADFLLRTARNDLILEILPEYSCEFMSEDYKYKCHYMRAKALYNKKDPGYLIPLNLAKDRVIQATALYEEIKKEGGIK